MDVCIIEDIKEEKKNSLKNNIQILENLYKNIGEDVNKLKIISEKINKKREELKMEILQIFTKIRNTLTERENELLSDIDIKYGLFYLEDNFIKESEKLPNKVKTILEKSKNFEKDFENNNNVDINLLVINIINIEQAINQMKILNEILVKNEGLKKIELKFIYEDKFNNIKESIKKFGKISFNGTLIKLDDSSIIKDNNLFIYDLNDLGENIKTELLFKKSKDGNSYDTFHKLCDNKGPTLILIKSSDGFIIGGYTPLDWDTKSSWKHDSKTFLFSLTNKKVYGKIEKNKKTQSIYCDKDVGPWFAFIGFRESGPKDLTQGEFLYREKIDEIYFENINDIIPNENKDRFFKVEEIEVYKLSFNN